MKAERWVFATDVHGDQADPDALAAFWDFLKHWRPQHKIHGGDNYDFRWLRGKASEGEQRERIEADVDAGHDFLKRFKPHVFITGNHDYRVFRAAESDDGKLVDLATRIILEMKEALDDAPILPWCKRRGVHKYGDRHFLHGYHSGVYAARQTATVYGNACFGHVHAHDMASFGRWEKVTAHSSGSIAKSDLDYNRGSPATLRQTTGWLYGLKYPSGQTQVFHAEKIGGVWCYPSEMREFRVEAKDKARR